MTGRKMKQESDGNYPLVGNLAEILLQADDMEWRAKSLKGVYERRWNNELVTSS